MEEEGIYYFFKHSDGSHQMVVTDVATQHPTVAGQSSVIYDEVSGGGPGPRIYRTSSPIARER